MITQFKNHKVLIEEDERPLPGDKTAAQLLHSHYVKLSITNDDGQIVATATRHGYSSSCLKAEGSAMPLTNLQRYLIAVEPVRRKDATT